MKCTLLAALAATITLVGLAAPAEAAAHASTITFNAAPEPVTAGAPVTLSGRAGWANTGNAGTVRFYFRSNSATAFTYIAAARTAANGTFSLRTRQSISGFWQAVYGGNAARKAVTSVVDHVAARAVRNVSSPRFSHTGRGDYTGPVGTWFADRSARVAVRVTCPDAADYNHVYVTWTGHPTWGYSSALFDFATVSYSGVQYMYPDEKTGYVDISTRSDCDWTVIISQVVRTWIVV